MARKHNYHWTASSHSIRTQRARAPHREPTPQPHKNNKIRTRKRTEDFLDNNQHIESNESARGRKDRNCLRHDESNTGKRENPGTPNAAGKRNMLRLRLLATTQVRPPPGQTASNENPTLCVFAFLRPNTHPRKSLVNESTPRSTQKSAHGNPSANPALGRLAWEVGLPAARGGAHQQRSPRRQRSCETRSRPRSLT
jgi:hypothetical protein